jgi:hypothetical protein
MSRLRFAEFRLSEAPSLCGLAREDIPRVSALATRAQNRILSCPEQGDEGWWGTYAEMAFSVSRTSPYLTTPREVARLQVTAVCDRPIPINNQFYEYLRWGNGRLPKFCRPFGPCLTAAYMRNNVPTFVDLTNAPQFIAVYPTNNADVGKKVLVQGMDANGSTVYSLDANNLNQIGQSVTLAVPFVATPQTFSTITGIQKEATYGPVQIFQMDPSTGATVLLLAMEPSEQSSGYRRYYFDRLPGSCCAGNCSPPQPVTITAIAALEAIPVAADSDYFLVQNLEALIAEAQSVYYAAKEDANSKAIAGERHKEAVRLLIGELTRYQGKNSPAVNWKPFGSARLERQKIGTML